MESTMETKADLERFAEQLAYLARSARKLARLARWGTNAGPAIDYITDQLAMLMDERTARLVRTAGAGSRVSS